MAGGMGRNTVKKKTARLPADEIAAAAKRHESRYGAAVQRQISTVTKRHSEEAESVVSFLVRHPPMALLTQDTRDFLKRRLDEGCEEAFLLCHHAPPLGVELPNEYPLMVIAWRLLSLMTEQCDRDSAGSKNLANHFREQGFGPRESRALASMVGLSALNSVLHHLRTRKAMRSAEVLMKTLPVVFGGMAAGFAARAGKKRKVADGCDRKRKLSVHLLLDRTFALACPPELGESFLDVSALFYEWAWTFKGGRSRDWTKSKGLMQLRDRVRGLPGEFQDAVAWRVKQVAGGKTKTLRENKIE